MKTAYYTVYYPLLMGCTLAGAATAGERRAIGRFALPLGHAFQVRDDILGVFGDRAEMGKSADSDILEGKKTVLVQNTIERLGPVEGKRFESLFTKAAKSASDLDEIRGMIRDSGALDKAVDMHRRLVDEAVRASSSLLIADAEREVLLGLCASIGALK